MVLTASQMAVEFGGENDFRVKRQKTTGETRRWWRKPGWKKARLRPHGGNSANFPSSERLVLWMNHHTSFFALRNPYGQSVQRLRTNCLSHSFVFLSIAFTGRLSYGRCGGAGDVIRCRKAVLIPVSEGRCNFWPKNARQNHILEVVRAAGVEPTTFGFGDRRKKPIVTAKIDGKFTGCHFGCIVPDSRHPNCLMATNAKQPKSKFRITEFINGGGTQSWRVSGIARDGTRLRQNLASLDAARGKQLELESEYLERHGPEVLKKTTLTDNQVRLAEAAFLRLKQDDDILPAIENWLTDGKHKHVENGRRLDDAIETFCVWLDASQLREKTRSNLKSRSRIFQSVIGDCLLTDISAETMDAFLAKKKVSLVTQANDVRAISRFLTFAVNVSAGGSNTIHAAET